MQCLQRLYGGAEPWVRHGGTMLALARLQDKGFLSGAEYGRLASAYQFLRQLEHRLQIADDRQTHTLPSQPDALELLGRRMPAGGGSAAWLLEQTQLHFEQVREIYDRVVHSSAASPEASAAASGRQAGNIVRALEQRAPHLAAALAGPSLNRGFKSFEHLLERISGDPARLSRLDADPRLGAHTFDLFEHSPYFAEELIRTPELLDEVARASETHALSAAPATVSGLRRWYRREMVRIQTASVCLSEPIFDTLVRTSELADAVIAQAYDIAVSEVRVGHQPADSAYQPIQPNVGDCAGPPGNARVRPGLRRRPGVRAGGLRRPGSGVLDPRGRAPGGSDHRLYRRRRAYSRWTRACGPTAATGRWC